MTSNMTPMAAMTKETTTYATDPYYQPPKLPAGRWYPKSEVPLQQLRERRHKYAKDNRALHNELSVVLEFSLGRKNEEYHIDIVSAIMSYLKQVNMVAWEKDAGLDFGAGQDLMRENSDGNGTFVDPGAELATSAKMVFQVCALHRMNIARGYCTCQEKTLEKQKIIASNKQPSLMQRKTSPPIQQTRTQALRQALQQASPRIPAKLSVQTPTEMSSATPQTLYASQQVAKQSSLQVALQVSPMASQGSQKQTAKQNLASGKQQTPAKLPAQETPRLTSVNQKKFPTRNQSALHSVPQIAPTKQQETPKNSSKISPKNQMSPQAQRPQAMPMQHAPMYRPQKVTRKTPVATYAVPPVSPPSSRNTPTTSHELRLGINSLYSVWDSPTAFQYDQFAMGAFSSPIIPRPSTYVEPTPMSNEVADIAHPTLLPGSSKFGTGLGKRTLDRFHEDVAQSIEAANKKVRRANEQLPSPPSSRPSPLEPLSDVIGCPETPITKLSPRMSPIIDSKSQHSSLNVYNYSHLLATPAAAPSTTSAYAYLASENSPFPDYVSVETTTGYFNVPGFRFMSDGTIVYLETGRSMSFMQFLDIFDAKRSSIGLSLSKRQWP